MHPLTKWTLGALLAIILLIAPAFTTFTYKTLAEDIESNEKQIEKLSEAVQKIEIHQAVDSAVQKQQTEVLQAILRELKSSDRRPGS